MLTSTQVFGIVTRVTREQGLSDAAASRLRLWASKWLSDFTRGREYSYRAVETMTRNAAASFAAQEGR